MLRRVAAAAGAVIAVVAFCLAVAPAPSATASDPCDVDTTWTPGGVDYTPCPEGGGSTPGGGTPGGAGGQPTCDLSGPATWCDGTRPCYTVPWRIPLRLPEAPAPSPTAEAYHDMCRSADGSYELVRIYWSEPGERVPPLEVQAQEATGHLQLQLPPLSTNPVDRTLVNLPTWFWIEGGQAEQIGTSAFGLRAVATFRSMHIDTGDGSGIDCPWTTTRAAAEESCTYTYRRASNDGTATVDGRPAYTVTATSTWDVRFELDGVTVAIPGAQSTLTGPPSTAVLRVAESQTVVNEAR